MLLYALLYMQLHVIVLLDFVLYLISTTVCTVYVAPYVRSSVYACVILALNACVLPGVSLWVQDVPPHRHACRDTEH